MQNIHRPKYQLVSRWLIDDSSFKSKQAYKLAHPVPIIVKSYVWFTCVGAILILTKNTSMMFPMHVVNNQKDWTTDFMLFGAWVYENSSPVTLFITLKLTYFFADFGQVTNLSNSDNKVLWEEQEDVDCIARGVLVVTDSAFVVVSSDHKSPNRSSLKFKRIRISCDKVTFFAILDVACFTLDIWNCIQLRTRFQILCP